MPDSSVKKERLWSRDFIIVMLASSGISFCNYFFVSTMPIYAQNLTHTTIYAGLMTTIYTFAALATRPLTGILAERIGRVKLLITGAVLCAVACFLYQFSTVIIVLILVRSLQGMGFGIHTTSSGATSADIIPKSRLSEGLGIFGLYGTLASALAPGIALTIVGNGDVSSFRPLFILAFVVAAVCVVLDTLIRYERVRFGRRGKADRKNLPGPETKPEATVQGEETPLPKTYIGFEAAVFLPAAFLILAYIAFGSLTTFLPLFAGKHHLGNIGLFFLINSGGMLFSRILLGKVVDRRGADIVVIPALFAVTVLIALIPFVHNSGTLYLLAFPIGLSQGAISPAINTMMFLRCSAKRRGSVSAAYFSALDIGYGAGAFLLGAIAQWQGLDFIYWVAALFALAATVLYILCLRQKKRKLKIAT